MSGRVYVAWMPRSGGAVVRGPYKTAERAAEALYDRLDAAHHRKRAMVRATTIAQARDIIARAWGVHPS